MPKRKLKPRPAAITFCPTCNNSMNFNILYATIRAQQFRQIGVEKWKRLSADPVKFQFQIPILMICDTCTQAMQVPRHFA